MTINEAIRAVRENCNNAQAVNYAETAIEVASEYGTEGLKIRIRHILSLTRGWRGEMAREAKKAMRDYLKRLC